MSIALSMIAVTLTVAAMIFALAKLADMSLEFILPDTVPEDYSGLTWRPAIFCLCAAAGTSYAVYGGILG